MTIADPTAALERAIEASIRGRPEELHVLLARGSRLPGVRPNLELAERFAVACRARGAAADAVVVRLATLDADLAPGATELEFLPMCGVVALGVRGAADASRLGRVLPVLEEAASDLRFRVRALVPVALARIGAAHGEALLPLVESWTQGFFPGAALLGALARTEWLSRITGADVVVPLVEASFLLAREADRSTERYPGYKALVEALGRSPGVLAARFGAPVFDVLERMSDVKEPVLREAIARSLDGQRLARRYGHEVARVRRALDLTAPKPRDPRSDVGPTRRRGKHRR